MIFLELTLENFGPYHGRHPLNLRPQDGRPIILIGGLHGGGETTLMDVLRRAGQFAIVASNRCRCSARQPSGERPCP